MIFPRALPRGGSIGICAPAGPVKKTRMDNAIMRLRESGYRIVEAPSLFGDVGLFAADDQTRLAELHAMFARADVDAVFCARGGVGCSRLLPALDGDLITNSRKPFLGFSDVTVLQWQLWKARQFVSYQGPLATEWDGGVEAESLENACKILAHEFDETTPWRDPAIELLRKGNSRSVVATLLPGNLTMITTLLGTPYLPDLTGCVLLIEDINEPPHRVDRMLFHLKNAGVLKNLAALCIGDLYDGSDEKVRATVQSSIIDATADTQYPVILGFPFGHGATRWTVPVGAAVELDLESLAMRPVNWPRLSAAV